MRQSLLCRLAIAGFFLTVLSASSERLSAANDPIEAIPDTAAAIVRFKVPRVTINKAVSLANLLDKSYGPKLTKLSKQVGTLIANPSGRGVDSKRDWWIALFPNPQGKTGIVFGIPAQKLSEMEQSVGKGYQFVRHGKWLFYTQDADLVKKIKARVAGKGQSIATVMDANSKQTLMRGDLSVYVNVRRLTEIYKSEIETAGQQFESTLNNLSEASPGGAIGNLKPMFKMYTTLFRGLMQGLKDTQGFTAAMVISNKGIAVEEYCHVTPRSTTDQFLQANRPSDMTVMEKLPTNKPVYWGIHGNVAGMARWGMGFSSALLGGNSDATSAIEKALKEYEKLKFGTIAGTFSLGSLNEGIIRTIGVTEVTPTSTVRTLTRQVAQAMSGLNAGGVKQTTTIKPDAEKYGKQTADLMVTKIELPAGPGAGGAGPGGAMAQQMMGRIFGPEGMTTRAVYLEKMVVQTLGGGRAAMEEALAALTGTGRKNTSSGTVDPSIKIMRAARNQIGKSSNLTVLIDLAGLLAKGVKIASTVAPLPFLPTPDEIDKLGMKRSFLGFSMVTEPAGLRTKTFVSVVQMQGINKIVGLFKRMLPPMGPAQRFERQKL